MREKQAAAEAKRAQQADSKKADAGAVVKQKFDVK